MKITAAVVHQAHQDFSIEQVELDEPKDHEGALLLKLVIKGRLIAI